LVPAHKICLLPDCTKRISKKEAIVFAQNYFAVQTLKLELIEQRINDWERLKARTKQLKSEKELSGLIFEQTGSDKNFAIIRSKGDDALLGGNTTKQMKIRLGVPKNRQLADFLPTITINAKDFQYFLKRFFCFLVYKFIYLH